MDITKYLKDTIQEEYGSLRRFARIIGMPNSTLITNLNKDNGFGKMPVDIAIKICKELDLDINEIYNYKVEPLTIEEKELLDNFKSLSKQGKDVIKQCVYSIKEFEENYEPENSNILIAASGAENLDDDEREKLNRDIEMVKNLE